MKRDEGLEEKREICETRHPDEETIMRGGRRQDGRGRENRGIKDLTVRGKRLLKERESL